MHSLNRPTSIKEIEFVLETFPQRKFQAQIIPLINPNKH